MLTFEELSVGLSDSGPLDDNLRWTTVFLKFKDEERGVHPSVTVSVCIESDESKSIAEVRQQALDHSKTILREALRLIEENDLASLRHKQDEYYRG